MKFSSGVFYQLIILIKCNLKTRLLRGKFALRILGILGIPSSQTRDGHINFCCLKNQIHAHDDINHHFKNQAYTTTKSTGVAPSI